MLVSLAFEEGNILEMKTCGTDSQETFLSFDSCSRHSCLERRER